MENKERLERRICSNIFDLLHGNMPYDDIATFIYEISYLRFLSLRTFKQIEQNRNFTLSSFINEYQNQMNDLVKEDIMIEILDPENINNNDKFKYMDFIDIKPYIELAQNVLDDMIRYQYSINDISKIIDIMCSYDNSIIKGIMRLDLLQNSRFAFQTPEQICSIVNNLLDISSNDNVLDIGSSYGNYLVNVNSCCDYNKLNGIEINHSLGLISKIRLITLTPCFNIEIKDIFRTNLTEKYDKIFCNYPLGYRVEKYQLDYIREIMNDMKFNWNKIGNSSFDWVFIDIMLTMLKNDGIGAAVMTAGSLFKISDEIYRKDLIDSGIISSVIKLPVLTKYTSIDQYLVIFSNNNNKVKFVDISKQVVKTYSGYSLMMDKAFDLLNSEKENEFVKYISNEVIAENGYLLQPEKYLEVREIKYFNPHKLSDFVIDVFRGYQMTSKEQEELHDENGNYEILMISDIENGVISDSLTKINSDENKYDRYLLKENDLIISSKGTRIKIAVISNIADRKIIANGNLIVLRLDSEKINPLYLEMYLNSEMGQTVLNQIQTGSVIISINPSRLTEITISMLPIEKQNELANKYKNKQKQILVAKEHLNNLQKEQEKFYDNEVLELFD